MYSAARWSGRWRGRHGNGCRWSAHRRGACAPPRVRPSGLRPARRRDKVEKQPSAAPGGSDPVRSRRGVLRAAELVARREHVAAERATALPGQLEIGAANPKGRSLPRCIAREPLARRQPTHRDCPARRTHEAAARPRPRSHRSADRSLDSAIRGMLEPAASSRRLDRTAPGLRWSEASARKRNRATIAHRRRRLANARCSTTSVEAAAFDATRSRDRRGTRTAIVPADREGEIQRR